MRGSAGRIGGDNCAFGGGWCGIRCTGSNVTELGVDGYGYPGSSLGNDTGGPWGIGQGGNEDVGCGWVFTAKGLWGGILRLVFDGMELDIAVLMYSGGGSVIHPGGIRWVVNPGIVGCGTGFKAIE